MGKYPVICPFCVIPLDSYESFEASGRILDQHLTAKHNQDVVAYEDELVGGFADEGRHAFKGEQIPLLQEGDVISYADGPVPAPGEGS